MLKLRWKVGDDSRFLLSRKLLLFKQPFVPYGRGTGLTELHPLHHTRRLQSPSKNGIIKVRLDDTRKASRSEDVNRD